MQHWSFGPVPALHDVMLDLPEDTAALVHLDVRVQHDRHAQATIPAALSGTSEQRNGHKTVRQTRRPTALLRWANVRLGT